MNKVKVESILNKAAEMCAKSGNRFTDKRKSILRTLVQSDIPLSAYEIADTYNETEGAKMPVMSVYRILDFLESEQLAHKLSSNNKYIDCSHITCCHTHKVPQFLICRNCKKVKEISVSKDIINKLEKQIDEAGFKLTDSHLELQCLCQECMAA